MSASGGFFARNADFEWAGNFHDPVVYSIVLLTLTLAIGAATAVPLRRALALQPGAALRHT